MTQADVARIEQALGVRLPQHYIAFQENFNGLHNDEYPIGHFIYAIAQDVIDVNKTVGLHTNQKLVQNKLIIGDNGGGGFYLIDLQNPTDTKVYVFDHEEWPSVNGPDLDQSYETLQDFKKGLEETFGIS